MTARPEKLRLLEAVALRECTWGPDAERWSRVIPHDFPGDFAGLLKERCQSGEWQVREIVSSGAVVGYFVYDIDPCKHCPPELVVVAMAGRDGSDLTETTAPHCIDLARELGCATVRFHTMRPGLIKKSRSLGFHVSEIILRANAA